MPNETLKERDNPGRFRRSELIVVAWLGIVAVAGLFYWMMPAEPDAEMVDHVLFTHTVDQMRDGSGYYQAMEDTLLVVYGPERAELTETVRGFRPPTTFLFWRLLPDDEAIWIAFAITAVSSGFLAAHLGDQPLTGVAVTGYLLAFGLLNRTGTWTAQFTTTELWAVPAMIGAALAITRKRWWLAAALALLATTIRETAATLLIVGSALALTGRVPRKPWLSATVAASVLYGIHAGLASRFIEPGVAAGLPSPAEVPGSFLRIVGLGLPAGEFVGPVLWLLAFVHLFRTQDNPYLLTAYLWLPLIGFFLERHYWGIMVVPFTLVWGIDGLVALLSDLRRHLRRTYQVASASR